MQLYMFYLGGNAGKSNIEVHDVQFVAVNKIEEAYPVLRDVWFGDKDKLHLDGYMPVTWADGYDCLLLGQISGYHVHLTENPHGQPDKPEWQGYRPIGI
ncbi:MULTISPECIES: DUF1543 domain-containing protein [Xenorhabdus]|uniref:DUF1543 domain-containing protein n=1 Tax=Xenorhabdus TaxID=626 RepID=UPI000B06E33C|nr:MULTISPECIES: DUF1543 domain-containing protein [Xenorhabdus]